MTSIPSVLHIYMDGLKAHDVNKIASTVAEEMQLITPQRTLNKEQFLAFLRALYAGFPDWRYEHSAPEREGEMIVVKWRQGGTHTGTLALPGAKPFAPTGKRVEIPEQPFRYRLRGGLIVEIRPEPIPGGAPLGILEQLGVALPP
jgi:hypothetical protein